MNTPTPEQLDQIIDDVTNAIALSIGIEFGQVSKHGIKYKRVKRDSRPLEKLKLDPLASGLIERINLFCPW